MNNNELLALLEGVKKALAEHPDWRAVIQYHFLRFDEYGWDVKVFCKPAGIRSTYEISGKGETPELACNDLVTKLDMWWEACK